MEEIKTALWCKQEVKTESIIPLLKNGQIESDEPFYSFVIFPCFLAPFLLTLIFAFLFLINFSSNLDLLDLFVTCFLLSFFKRLLF